MTLDLPDEQAVALQEKAAAAGLTLEQWIMSLAREEVNAEQQPLQAAADIILKRMRKVPDELMSTMPADGASQHDHYIYGWPKKEE